VPPFTEQLFCGLAKTAASENSLAGQPGGVFRGQKDSDGGDITWLADAAERGLREGGLFELRSDELNASATPSITEYQGRSPWLVSARVNRAVRRCDATGNGANVNDAAPFSEVLHSGLRNKEEAQYIDVEVPVKVLLGDGLEGSVLGAEPDIVQLTNRFRYGAKPTGLAELPPVMKQHKSCTGDQRRRQGSEEKVEWRNTGLSKKRRKD
jgi:hypothetical protein